MQKSKQNKGNRRGIPRGRKALREIEIQRKRESERCEIAVDESTTLLTYFEKVEKTHRSGSEFIDSSLKKMGEVYPDAPPHTLLAAFRQGDEEWIAELRKRIAKRDKFLAQQFKTQNPDPINIDGETILASRRMLAQEGAYQDRDTTAPVNEEEVISTIKFLLGRKWEDKDSWPRMEFFRRYFGIPAKVLSKIAKKGRWGARDVVVRASRQHSRAGHPGLVLSPRAVAKVMRYVAVEWPAASEKALLLAKELDSFKK